MSTTQTTARRPPRTNRRGAALILTLALTLAPFLAVDTQAREVYGLSETELGLYLGNNLLGSWRVAEARELADNMLAQDPANPETKGFDAHVLFFEGHYAESLEGLKELGVEGPFRNLVEATAEAARGFQSRESEHFVVSWSNPKDEILVEPALETLEATRAAVTRELGFASDEKVRVEVYPSVASFTSVSTLTRTEVETSGTIGLCKFNRIMLTSPRATLWGYRWRDTLCHEYVHLALFRISGGLAPIWVHEGVAKYLEASWRGVVGELKPSGGALLARRLEEGSLISLEEMSPSVAKLPSAEDTALAFAEVGTMMTFLVEQRGAGALRRLSEAIGAGSTDREALESVWGESFASFDEAWREWAETLPSRREDIQVIGLRLADHGQSEEEEPGVISDPRGRDYVRLGDLLRARGRVAAASIEYTKAYAEAPEAPGVASRHAMGLVALGRFDEAVDVADGALVLYPDLPTLWHRKGSALLALGRHREAIDALSALLEINPFHLPARRELLMAARALEDRQEIERQEWALGLLEGEHSSR